MASKKKKIVKWEDDIPNGKLIIDDVGIEEVGVKDLSVGDGGVPNYDIAKVRKALSDVVRVDFVQDGVDYTIVVHKEDGPSVDIYAGQLLPPTTDRLIEQIKNYEPVKLDTENMKATAAAFAVFEESD